jgi:NhaA family Na+:H+ antiporter
VYTVCNLGARAGASAAGWAVPMATDIAFAMGVFGFFKSRMPPGAQAFLLTLATVDDLGAIAVIAILCELAATALRWLACLAMLREFLLT